MTALFYLFVLLAACVGIHAIVSGLDNTHQQHKGGAR